MNVEFENKVLYPVRYDKKKRDFVPNERLIFVRNTNDFVQKEIENIDKIIFMRRRTKEKLKRQLILNNLNAVIDLFNDITMKGKRKFLLKKSVVYGRITYFMEDIIISLCNEMLPFISVFKHKLYLKVDELRSEFVNTVKHTINHRDISVENMSDSFYSHSSLFYAEFLLPIVILRMTRYFIVTRKS